MTIKPPALLSNATSSQTTPPYDGSEEYNERLASLSPAGTHPFIRPPPPPHALSSRVTPDASLFQTIHFAPAPTISLSAYRLVIAGQVKQSLCLSLSDLRALPSTTVTAFHECYGPPTLPPDTNRWRVGNVQWTGVRLSQLLALAGIAATTTTASPSTYVWADGLDHGTFQSVYSDRFRKDLPLSKALQDEVLVAWAINGEPLSKERGGPVRLVVPGWFGTNSVKWLCRLEVREGRAEGDFVGKGRFYNEEVPEGEGWDGNVCWHSEGKLRRPVWGIQVNSLVFSPRPDEVFVVENGNEGRDIDVEGWAWSDAGVEGVEVSLNEGATWERARVEERKDYSWQNFRFTKMVGTGDWKVIVRAECKSGMKQPLQGRRNHVHSVGFRVE